MNDVDRRRVRAQLRYRFAFLGMADELVDEVYAWAWVFSLGGMDAKSIDKACRVQAMSLGWRRRGGIGKWHRKEVPSAWLGNVTTPERILMRSPGPMAPRVRNRHFKRTPLAQR